MPIQTYLYQGSAGIKASDLVPLLAVGAGPVVQVPSQFGFLPVTVDSSHKADLDAAMADLGYAYVGLYTDPLPATTKDYGALAANPTGPSLATGDTYYNTVLEMRMVYEGNTRSKWLSVESSDFVFGRNGATAAAQYYRTVDGRIMSATIGWRMGYPGTVVSVQYVRGNVAGATFDVVANGVSIGTLVSAALAGGNNAFNADFSAGNILAVLNQVGSAVTQDVVGWLRVRWRSP